MTTETEEQLREQLREEYPLLVEMKFDPYWTESNARRVAEFAQEKITTLKTERDELYAAIELVNEQLANLETIGSPVSCRLATRIRAFICDMLMESKVHQNKQTKEEQA